MFGGPLGATSLVPPAGLAAALTAETLSPRAHFVCREVVEEVRAVLEVLAHGAAGSWDEVALVAAPFVLLLGFIWISNRRADRQGERSDEEP